MTIDLSVHEHMYTQVSQSIHREISQQLLSQRRDVHLSQDQSCTKLEKVELIKKRWGVQTIVLPLSHKLSIVAF